MAVFGIILLVGGILSALYGNSLNNDIEAQLASLFSEGTTNPGDIFLYVGIAAAVIGLICMVAGFSRRK